MKQTLWTRNFTRITAATTLGDLPVRSGLKAEAVTILGQRDGGLDVLIGYDGAKNGAFERYRIPLN